MRIVDAVPGVVNVQHYEAAARGMVITTLRAVVGDIMLGEVLANREAFNEALRGKLDDMTDRWDITVTAVEFRHGPPRAGRGQRRRDGALAARGR